MDIITNNPYFVKFLDHSLHKRKGNDQASILQLNLFVALTSSETIVLVRLFSILHIFVCMPIRWLAGKTHELKEHGWGPMSMGRVLDTLEASMEDSSEDGIDIPVSMLGLMSLNSPLVYVTALLEI